MLVGNAANKKTTRAAAFSCHVNYDYSGDVTLDNFNFARDCPWGMKTELYFPQCWDGVNLYLSDNSHMSYPMGGSMRDGQCPITHPVRVPTIQLEYTWYPSNYAPGVALAGNLIWANGDTTGYGIHGDFVNGWNTAVLAAALNSTACGIGGGQSIAVANCPIFAQYINDNAAANCKPDRGILAEPVSNADLYPLTKLPGCNPTWGATGAKPKCNPAVTPLDVSALTGTDGAYVVPLSEREDLVLPTNLTWGKYACVSNAASILNAVHYTDSLMTQESCQQSCSAANYQWAAIGQEGGVFNCLCGTGLDRNSPIATGLCTAQCPGNSAETCGGNYEFDTFYAPNGTQFSFPRVASGAEILGCYNNPSTISQGLLGAATYSFSSGSMTTEVCLQACAAQGSVWAATTAGKSCYCGTNLSFGTGTFVSTLSNCNQHCNGNSSEICGDYYRSTVYNIAAASYSNSSNFHPAGWQGCFAEGSGHFALQNTSWSLSTMTPMQCINGCSELGYQYAGLEQGNRCFCGNSFNGGQRLPESQCGTACAGNSSAVCGGGTSLDLYTVGNAAIVTAATVDANQPVPYLGCYVDSGATVSLTNYTYSTSSMTVRTCLSACSGFGYPYAGLTGASECKCGQTPPQTLQLPTATYCTTKCSGNSSEACGGSGYLEAYNVTTLLALSSPASSTYVGCYADSNKGLSNYKFSVSNMDITTCRTACLELEYTMGGVDGGTNCYCGNTWTGGQTLPDSSCTTPCPNNSSQICGGTNIISVYKTAGAPVTAAKQPTAWIGCYGEPSTGRALNGYSYSISPMSSRVCRTACLAKGYSIAGVEGGNQCFCDNAINTAATHLPQIMCTTPCSGFANETCGGSWKLDVYNTTGATVYATGVPGYVGCFTDDSKLTGYSFSSDYMSVNICNTQCFVRGYAYGGVRDGNQCKCGSTSPVTLTTTSSCANPCSADSTQSCGTASTIAVYQISQTGITNGSFNTTADSTGFVGCYGGSSVIPYNAFTSSAMTQSMCNSNCQALGYAYAGTNNGKNCYCGNSLNPLSGGYQVKTSDCSTACPGGTGTCGGSSSWSIYSVGTAKAPSVASVEGLTGCYAPGAFYSSSTPFQYKSSQMSTTLCRRTCHNLGYSIAGLTAGNICACGSTPNYGALLAPAYCANNCSGNSSVTCGAANSAALSIYDTAGTGALPPSSGYPTNYIGCYADTSPRLLNAYFYSNNGMTALMCSRICTGYGYKVYGTETGVQCYCSASVPSAGLLPDSYCSSNCGGESHGCQKRPSVR